MNAPAEKSTFAVQVRTALFDITAGDPSRHPRLILWIVCSLFAVLLIWATFAKLDIVAVAQGRLVPQTYVKIVQPADAGIVKEILVEEGDEVRKGQVLVRLDSTVASADSRAALSQLQLKRLELRRIDAQLAGRPLAREAGDDSALFMQVQADTLARTRVYLDTLAQERAILERTESELLSAQETLKKLQRTLPSYEQSAAAYEKLAKDKLVGALLAEEKKREAVEKSQDLKSQEAYVSSLESSHRAQQNKITQLTSAYRGQLHAERVNVLSDSTRFEEENAKYDFREGLLELRAPQDGIVKELATTTVGAVVQPGTVLLSLVPRHEPLLAEVQIENKDIGFVHPEQSVRLKLAAYPFQKYGMIEGVVKTISADSAMHDSSDKAQIKETDRNGAAGFAFKALIELKRQQLEINDLALPLTAGMEVSAEIKQGNRTVLEYLLSPVRRIANEAGIER
jgi:HlyD family secretion protein